MKGDKEKIMVTTGCILSVGTVPTGCILSVGTVPTGCILTVGTVPTDNLSHYVLLCISIYDSVSLCIPVYEYI